MFEHIPSDYIENSIIDHNAWDKPVSRCSDDVGNTPFPHKNY